MTRRSKPTSPPVRPRANATNRATDRAISPAPAAVKVKIIRPVTDWSASLDHLRKVDPVLRELIDYAGPPPLRIRRDYFVKLCESIFSQASTKVADVMFERFRNLFPRRRPTPAALLRIAAAKNGKQKLRACGLSRQKTAYLIDLATHFNDNRIPTNRLSRMTDEQVAQALIAVKGIGQWTAEMFLIFVLNRPDILPVADLGLQEGIRICYGLKDRPQARAIHALAQKWQPHRTAATWYLWRGVERHRKKSGATTK